MRLLRVERATPGLYTIRFTQQGVQGEVTIPRWNVPSEGWEAWARAQVTAYLKKQNPQSQHEVVWPNEALPENAVTDYSGLSGWATWAAADAAQWIESNITDLSSAKAALKDMAKALCYLRDIVIER